MINDVIFAIFRIIMASNVIFEILKDYIRLSNNLISLDRLPSPVLACSSRSLAVHLLHVPLASPRSPLSLDALAAGGGFLLQHQLQSRSTMILRVSADFYHNINFKVDLQLLSRVLTVASSAFDSIMLG